MLYLFNSAARVGYIENVLNTLHLPKGAENVYQYSIMSGPYVHANISQIVKNEEALIIFVNKDTDPYQFIPLRKATFLSKEVTDGRIYFSVILGDYCIPRNNDYVKFSKIFIENFGEFVFRAKSEEDASKVDTKEQKNNKGFLAFTGTSFSDNLFVTDDSWLNTIEIIKKVKILAENNCVYTKMKIKKDGELFPTSKIEKVGSPVFNLNFGSNYCAELSYYIPFQDEKTGSYLEVEMISNPDTDNLKGGSLKQRLNVLQGVANFRFKATEVIDSGEIIFSLQNAVGIKAENIKMAWRGVSYRVKRSRGRWSCIIILLLVAAACGLGSIYFPDCISNAATGDNCSWYYVLTALSSLILPLSIWGASILFGKKG